MAGRWS
jgi:hypothetical protein